MRYTPRGTAVAKTGIAVNRRFKDPTTGEQREETLFIDITIFGRSAEFANQYLRKGRRILVEGRLAYDQWTAPDGSRRSKHSVIAEKIAFMDSRSDFAGGGGGVAGNDPGGSSHLNRYPGAGETGFRPSQPGTGGTAGIDGIPQSGYSQPYPGGYPGGYPGNYPGEGVDTNPKSDKNFQPKQENPAENKSDKLATINLDEDLPF